MTKYLARTVWDAKITPVEVIRETDSIYWTTRGRALKEGSYGKLFDTFEEAKQFLLDQKRQEIERSKRNTSRLSAEWDVINKIQL